MFLLLLIKLALVLVVSSPLKTATDVVWEFTCYSVESSTWSNTQGSGAKKLCFETRSFQCPKPTPRHTAWSKRWVCAICCCRFNVNYGSYSPFQTHLGQGLRTQTIFSAYLLSKCIFLHVHFCLPNTVWYECELSVPGVHWKWRDISSRQAFARCSSVTRDRWGKPSSH